MTHSCPAAVVGRSLGAIGYIVSRSCGADAIAMTFRGPIPAWLDPETAGHRYWKPPEIPVKLAGHALLDGASAIYAFAPEHLRRDLEAADEALRLLGVPTDPHRRQTLQWIEHLHRENQEVISKQTLEFQAWCRWKIALNIIPAHIVPPLMDGRLRAFGDPDRPGSHPHWIDPRTWLALEADPAMPGKFAGHGLVFWNVRLVDPLSFVPPLTDEIEGRGVIETVAIRRRTGTAGRPSSKMLVVEQMRLRAARGVLAPTLAEEARCLCAWLRGDHPNEAQPLEKSLSNSIRVEYKQLRDA